MTTISCPKCGFENESGDLFCVECGSALPQTAAVEPARKESKRFPLIPVILAAIVLLIAGTVVTAFLTGRLSFPSTKTKAPSEQKFVSTTAPFLVLQTPGQHALDVILVELNGDELGRIGATTGADRIPMYFLDGEYGMSGFGSQTGQGAEAWAWPDDSVALIALQTPAGWDLLRFDIANAEVKELVQGVEWVNVQGYVQAKKYAAGYRHKGRQSLWIADRHNEEVIELLRREKTAYAILSPDGQHVFYWNEEDGFVANTDGRQTYQLDKFSVGQGGDFSSDGRILFYSTGHQIVRVDADGGNGRIIAEVGRNDEIQPAAVGKATLAMQQNVGGRYDLRIMSWDGETKSRFGRSDQPYYPRYLPGDNGILVFMNEGDGWKIELANVNGEERQTLLQGIDGFPLVAMLKDDRHFAVGFAQEGYWNLRLYDSKNGESEELERDTDELALLAADDKHLIYASRLGEDWSLMAADIRSGETWELDAGAPEGYPIAFFTPKGDGVVYEARSQTITREIVDEENGFAQVLQYPEADLFQVDLKRPDPKLLYTNANLLAASLPR